MLDPIGRRMCLALVSVAAVLAGLGLVPGEAQATPTAVSVHGSTPGAPPTLQAPVISRFRPFFGGVGTRVKIKGRDFLGATVSFNGTPSVLIKDTPTVIKTTVPVGATSGSIRVTTSEGTVASARSFTVMPDPSP